jgi:hypothetical protein
MTRDDAALDEILDELEHAEGRARRAVHALAEAEENAVEEDAASRAGVGACRARLEAAGDRVALAESLARLEAELAAALARLEADLDAAETVLAAKVVIGELG